MLSPSFCLVALHFSGNCFICRPKNRVMSLNLGPLLPFGRPELIPATLALGTPAIAGVVSFFRERVSSLWTHPKIVKAIDQAKFRLDTVPIAQKIAWITGLQKGYTRPEDERAIRDVFLSIRNYYDMVRAVVAIESERDYYDFAELMEGDIDNAAIRQAIHSHVRQYLPRANLVWFGDTIEGDFQTALLLSQKFPGRVVSFIRLAEPSDDENMGKMIGDLASVNRRATSPMKTSPDDLTTLQKFSEYLARRQIYLIRDYSGVAQQFDRIKGAASWIAASDVDETSVIRKKGPERLIPGHREVILHVNKTNRYLPEEACPDFLYVVTARPSLLEFDALNSLRRLGRTQRAYQCTAVRSVPTSAHLSIFRKEKWHTALADQKLKLLSAILDLWNGS